MEPLNHAIALRVETGCLDPVDSEDGANLQPDQRGELSSSIRGAGTPNLETQQEMKARAQASAVMAVMEERGTASGLSIMVRM